MGLRVDIGRSEAAATEARRMRQRNFGISSGRAAGLERRTAGTYRFNLYRGHITEAWRDWLRSRGDGFQSQLWMASEHNAYVVKRQMLRLP